MDLSGLKIKVCGMRDPENIRELAKLEPDYMGFIFYAPSKRYAENIAPTLLSSLPASIKKTGVFVDASFNEIHNIAKTLNLDVVQLHGNEPVELSLKLKKQGYEVLKAFGIDEDFNFEILNHYADSVDFFLFDTKTKLHGGSGITFNWNLLNKYTLSKPYFLSGGLDPENIIEALKITDSRFYGLDLNSKFETAPGLKDLDKLTPVLTNIRSIRRAD